MPPLEQDMPFKCIELISTLALPELTATMRRTARTRLGQGGGRGCARPSARRPGRVRDDRGRPVWCEPRSGRPAAPLNKVLAGLNSVDTGLELLLGKGVTSHHARRLPGTTVRYDDAREPARLSCSDRNSNDGRSTTAASRSLEDSSPRLAGSTAHTRIVGGASSRSPI